MPINPAAALTGFGQAQPQIQQLQDQQRTRSSMAQLFQALSQARAQQGGAPGGGGRPGQPGGGGMFGGQPAPGGATPSALPGSGPAAGMPSLEQIIEQISNTPGDDAAKMQALEHYGAFISPFDKMTQQLEMKQAQLSNANSMLETRMQSMRDLQLLRNQQSGANAETRSNTASTGQDISILAKEYQGARSHLDTMLNSMGSRALDTPEYKEAQAEVKAAKVALDAAKKGSTAKPAAVETPAKNAAAKPGNKGSLPVIKTQAEYDALPSGEQYQEEDGNTYTKP